MSAFDLWDETVIQRIQRHAAEAQTVPPRFLRYDTGVWTVGGEDVTESTWLALSDKITIGWKLFIQDRVVEEHMVLALANGTPDRPSSHSDKSKWKTGPGGWPKDPWSRQYSLPLLNEGSGQVIKFNAGTTATRTAVGLLLDDIAITRRRPVVALSSQKVLIDGKDVLHPLFAITGHSENDDPMRGIAVETDIVHPAGIKPNDGGLDDGIPF